MQFCLVTVHLKCLLKERLTGQILYFKKISIIPTENSFSFSRITDSNKVSFLPSKYVIIIPKTLVILVFLIFIRTCFRLYNH
jgi:hypothetical protein